MKTTRTSLSRGVVLAGMVALIIAAATSAAEAKKRVCYKDPGRGTVCQVVD